VADSREEYRRALDSALRLAGSGAAGSALGELALCDVVSRISRTSVASHSITVELDARGRRGERVQVSAQSAQHALSSAIRQLITRSFPESR
jgi:hypothetical protein